MSGTPELPKKYEVPDFHDFFVIAMVPPAETPETQEAKVGFRDDVNSYLEEIHAARESRSVAVSRVPFVRPDRIFLPTGVTATEIETYDGTDTMLKGWDLEWKAGMPLETSTIVYGPGVTLMGDGVTSRLWLQAVLPSSKFEGGTQIIEIKGKDPVEEAQNGSVFRMSRHATGSDVATCRIEDFNDAEHHKETYRLRGSGYFSQYVPAEGGGSEEKGVRTVAEIEAARAVFVGVRNVIDQALGR